MLSFYVRLMIPPTMLPTAGRAASNKGRNPPFCNIFRLFTTLVLEFVNFRNCFVCFISLFLSVGRIWDLRSFFTSVTNWLMNLLFARSIACRRWLGFNFFKRLITVANLLLPPPRFVD